MTRENISSASPWEPKVGFSRAVRVGNMIVVSGTGPVAPDGSTASPGDAYGQAKRCLEIIKEAIEDSLTKAGRDDLRANFLAGNAVFSASKKQFKGYLAKFPKLVGESALKKPEEAVCVGTSHFHD